MRGALALMLALGCGRFGYDERDPLARPIPHVPDGTVWTGSGELVLDGAVLDTSELTVDELVPARAAFFVVPQPSGEELAILQADTIRIHDARVTGARGLVIVARHLLVIDGVLDAGARGSEPGPGARSDGAGPGVHPPASVCDGGGGGGGHGTAGAPGGGTSCELAGGAGGDESGDAELVLLAGGTAGGTGVSDNCGLPAGGGGGGALQLSAGTSLVVAATGVVTAAGGGGRGGLECGDGDAGSGAGGGAGGAIYLDAPSIEIEGLVIAHGGGGGAGANGDAMNGPVGAGQPGADGVTWVPAAGGLPPATNAGSGGMGGAGAVLPTTSPRVEHNAGGGGGAVGRIVVDGALDGRGMISPAPVTR